MLDSRLTIGKPTITNQFGFADNATQCAPFVIVADGNHAPAIIALAPVAAMRRRSSVMIALRFWIIAVNRSFEIGSTERVSGAFDLRQIDGDSFAGPAAI